MCRAGCPQPAGAGDSPRGAPKGAAGENVYYFEMSILDGRLNIVKLEVELKLVNAARISIVALSIFAIIPNIHAVAVLLICSGKGIEGSIFKRQCCIFALHRNCCIAEINLFEVSTLTISSNDSNMDSLVNVSRIGLILAQS